LSQIIKKGKKKGMEAKHSSTKLNQPNHEGNKTSSAASFLIHKLVCQCYYRWIIIL